MASGDPKQEGTENEHPGESGGTGKSVDEPQGVDRRLLEILVCPLTKTRLVLNAGRNELVSRAAGLAFPIEDGVPLLTREAARELRDDEL